MYLLLLVVVVDSNLPSALLPAEATALGGDPCQAGHHRQRQITDHTVQRVRFLLDDAGTHEDPRQRFLLLHQGYLAVGHFSIRFVTNKQRLNNPLWIPVQIHFIFELQFFFFFYYKFYGKTFSLMA